MIRYRGGALAIGVHGASTPASKEGSSFEDLLHTLKSKVRAASAPACSIGRGKANLIGFRYLTERAILGRGNERSPGPMLSTRNLIPLLTLHTRRRVRGCLEHRLPCTGGRR